MADQPERFRVGKYVSLVLMERSRYTTEKQLPGHRASCATIAGLLFRGHLGSLSVMAFLARSSQTRSYFTFFDLLSILSALILVTLGPPLTHPHCGIIQSLLEKSDMQYKHPFSHSPSPYLLRIQ